MKKFELICTDEGYEKGNQTQLHSEGYTALELIALLELKKQEIIDAMKEAAGPAHIEVEHMKGEKNNAEN